MKKVIAILLAALMVLSLCACGKEEPSLADSVQKVTVTEPAATTAPETTAPTAPPVDMTTVETGMFTLSFPTDDGWTYEEDDITDRDYLCDACIQIRDDSDKLELSMYVYACEDDPYEYRENLYDRGFDEYALVEENAYADSYVEIGGQKLLRWDNTSGDTRYYFGRNESAGVNLSIQIQYAPDDSRVEPVLEYLQFHLEDVGNVDGPWYWEGEPFRMDPLSAMCGTYTLSSAFIPMDEPLITHEVFDHDMVVNGSKAYIVSGGKLLEYDFDGSSLTYTAEIQLDREYENLDLAKDGTLLLSSFADPYIGIRDGEKVFSYDGVDDFAPAPDGTWGISYFTSLDHLEKYTFKDGAASHEHFETTGLSSATGAWVDDSYIFITGRDEAEDAVILQAYDYAGNLKYTLLGEDGRLGSLTFATKTANGFLALDGNMREVVLWNNNGELIGTVDDRDIFGTNYPWFCAGQKQPDGSIILVMTEDRTDDSAMELVAFRMKGF